MGQPIIQPSFAAGELSPSLYARVDLAKWHSGAALLENFFVDYRGGVSNRPGTKWLGFSLDSSQPSRLIPFIFSITQAYVLVFDNLKMRVIRDGGFVAGDGRFDHYAIDTPYSGGDLALLKFTQSADVMTLVHPAYAPMQLTRTAHDNWVLEVITFVPDSNTPTNIFATAAAGAGTTSYYYKVTAVASNGITESIPSVRSTGTAETAQTMSATANEHMTVSWDEVPGAQLYNVYRQAEVPEGAPAAAQLFGFVGSVEHTGSGTASFVDANIAPDFTQTPPQENYPFADPHSGEVASLLVTQGSGFQTVPTLGFTGGGGSGAAATVSLGAVSAGVGPFPGAGFAVNDVLTLVGGTFTRAAQIRITQVSPGYTFSVVDPGSYTVLPGLALTNGMNNISVSGGSGFGLTLFVVFGLSEATVTAGGSGYSSPPTVGIFGGGGFGVGGALTAVVIPSVIRNPTCVTYYQQRQVFAAPPDKPQTMYFSKTADYVNFNYSSPSRPDDSIEATLASQQVNAIKHLVPLQSLIALTSAGAWRIDSGQEGGAITPSNIDAVPQIFNGSSDVPPLVIGRQLLYVQSKGSIIRNLEFNFIENTYSGNDLTALANHLFFGRQIVEWAWAEEPFKVVWAVRDDGVLLSFTYLKEQEIYAWSHHVTEGRVKNICSIPEGTEDALYLIIERYIQGGVHHFIERMASRDMGAIPEGAPNLYANTQAFGIQGSIPVPADLSRAWFVDAGLQYPLTYPAANLHPGATTATLSIVSVEVIAGGSGYVDPVIVITDETGSGAEITATVVGGVITAVTLVTSGSDYTNPAITVQDSAGTGGVVGVQLSRDVSFTTDAPAFTSDMVGAKLRAHNGWGVVRLVQGTQEVIVNVERPLTSTWPVLAGDWSCTIPVSSVSGLDHLEGEWVAILADGNVMPGQQVVNGGVILEEPASAIFVGLPYRARFKSLYLDLPGESPTVQGKRKKISAVTVRQQDTRGLRIGHDFDNMVEVKERDFQDMGAPILPFTGDRRINLDGLWGVEAQVCIEQPDPLPATILGLIPEVTLGDQPGNAP